MRTIRVVDETFVDAPLPVVWAALADESRLAQVWGQSSLAVRERDAHLLVWRLPEPLDGDADLTVRAHWDGVIVRHSVLAQTAVLRVRRIERAHVFAWKRHITGIKDALETRRGAPRLGGGESVHSRTARPPSGASGR